MGGDKTEPEGKEGTQKFVSCCGDGDVVNVGGGNGDGFGESRENRKERRCCLGYRIYNVSKEPSVTVGRSARGV